MKSRRRLRYAVCLLSGCFVVGLAATTFAQVENYFRRDAGLAADDSRPLPDSLDDEHLVWKTALPLGHSTPILVGDRMLLTAHEGNELLTVCLDRNDGHVLWKQAVEVDQLEKVHPEGSPAAASCASDGRRVYSFFGSYGLVCYDLAGTPVWTKKLGPFRDEFGAASSPILLDSKLILNEDHDLDSYILALRADTGDVVWQTPQTVSHAATRHRWCGKWQAARRLSRLARCSLWRTTRPMVIRCGRWMALRES